jgi:ABC-type glycerol-3-phosphate transport system permease component
VIENRPIVTLVSHCMLIAGIAIIAFPIWITFVAATHDAVRMTQIPLPLLPGTHFFANLEQALNQGIDGAGPMRFYFDILLPISRTDIAALFVILFIYGWNQYLWPLLITTDQDMFTIVMAIKQMLEAAEQSPEWNIIMMTALLAMMPLVLVVIFMQKLFVKGLTETEK